MKEQEQHEAGLKEAQPSQTLSAGNSERPACRQYNSDGERKVRGAFNPSGSGAVWELKTLGAELINKIGEMKADPSWDKATQNEFYRLQSKAVGLFEDGTMQAVKMATTGM